MSGTSTYSETSTRDWTPATVADHISIVLSLTIYFINLLALLYATYHRKYPPLKAKQISMVALALFGSFCWYIGNLHATGALGHSGIFRVCILWDIWLQVIFGVQLILSVMAYRLYKLHRILIQEKAARGVGFWGVVCLLWVPIVVLGVASQIVPDRHSVWYDEGNDWCQWGKGFKYVMLVWPVLGLGVLLYLNISLRNIRKSFNEYSEQRIGFIASFATLISYALIDGVYEIGNKNVVLRILQATLVLLAGNIYFWVTIGKPLYGHIFKKQQHLAEFRAGLSLSVSGRNTLPNSNGVISAPLEGWGPNSIPLSSQGTLSKSGTGKRRGSVTV